MATVDGTYGTVSDRETDRARSFDDWNKLHAKVLRHKCNTYGLDITGLKKVIRRRLLLEPPSWNKWRIAPNWHNATPGTISREADPPRWPHSTSTTTWCWTTTPAMTTTPFPTAVTADERFSNFQADCFQCCLLLMMLLCVLLNYCCLLLLLCFVGSLSVLSILGVSIELLLSSWWLSTQRKKLIFCDVKIISKKFPEIWKLWAWLWRWYVCACRVVSPVFTFHCFKNSVRVNVGWGEGQTTVTSHK